MARLRASPHFRTIAPAASAMLGDDADGARAAFPSVDVYGRVFALQVGAPVRFVESPPKPRRWRRKEVVDPRTLYDARITLERVVPSRPGSWHDLTNALVWGTFPRAKAALHARQHRAITARIVPGARTLPPTRTRELDALALLDEGGVLLVPGETPSGESARVVFGHAIYESLAAGTPPAVVAAIELDVAAARGRSIEVAALDRALASVLEDPARLQSPGELRRIDLSVGTSSDGAGPAALVP
ncbi:MAG TPA: DUF3025 domain-containing protein [Polyangiaceae bacterium]|nr:DUF3025 domain-containing protein [Polyangiaceae bacterium]